MKYKFCQVESCGKAFEDHGKGQKFCSNACKQKAYRDRNQWRRKLPKKPKLKVRKQCRYCGEYFMTEHPRQIFCKPSHKTMLYTQLKRIEDRRRGELTRQELIARAVG